MKNVDELEQYLSNFNNITIVTGAGISTLSGIPDYSTMDGTIVAGIYYSPRQIFSLNFIDRYPEDYWEWHKEHFSKVYSPNKVHNWISKLIKNNPNKNINVITQNIDGLQYKSFNKYEIDKEIIEFHGNLNYFECLNCNSNFTKESEICPYCNSKKVKPNIVFYGQNINKDNYIKAEKLLRSSDVILVLGTSLEVQPLSGLVLFNGDENVIWIDKKKNEVAEENGYVTFIETDFKKFFKE